MSRISRSPRSRRTLAALSVIASLGVLAIAKDADARPSRWTMAREPVRYREHVAERVAQSELLDHYLVRAGLDAFPAEDANAHPKNARDALMGVKADTSTDPAIRMILAKANHELHRFAEAAALLESVVKDAAAPPVMKADAYGDLAISYARLDRVDDEIAAYDQAIALDPSTRSRSTFSANCAEAFMLKGDISNAIKHYRASLDMVSAVEQRVFSPTTYWGLAVALDRSGDLDGAIQNVFIARTLDPYDKNIGGSNWFFIPAYDEAYYNALGHWMTARKADDVDLQSEAYEHAILSWQEFLLRAPETDPYRAVATARLKTIQKEYGAFSKKAREVPPTSSDGPIRSGPTP